MIKKSFTIRVLIISFLALALPLLIDSFIFFQLIYFDSISAAKSDLKTKVNFRLFDLSGLKPVQEFFLRELIYIMKLNEQLANFDVSKMNKELMKIVHVGGEFQLFIIQIEKPPLFKIIASSQESLVDTYFISYQLFEQILKKGEGTFIRYNYEGEDKHYVPYVVTAQLIKSENADKPIGIIIASANITEQINKLISKTNQKNIKFALLNEDGIVFAATDSKLKGQFLGPPISQKRRNEILLSGQLGIRTLSETPLHLVKNDDAPFIEFVFNDQVQIAYVSKELIGGISIISYASKKEFFSSAIRHFILLYIIYGLILIIGGGIIYWIALWISRPLRQLSRLMTQVGKGKLDARFKKESLGFEINILGNLFNITLDNLLKNIQHAEDERVKKETYQRELSIIRRMQNNLIPHHTPVIKGAELVGNFLPAINTGGDYFAYHTAKIKSGEEVVRIAVADTAGEGFFSCLYALSLRGLIRSHATFSDDLREVLIKSNNAFIQNAGDSGMFVTIFYGRYHFDSKILYYCSCGYIPGFVRKANGKIISLIRSGIAIGLKESPPYLIDSIPLEPEDLVILYTYGLLKAKNKNNESFTESRLKNYIQSKQWRSAQEVVDCVTVEIQEFTQSLPQEKEIIIVALRVQSNIID